MLDGDITLNNQFETLQPEGKAHYPYVRAPMAEPRTHSRLRRHCFGFQVISSASGSRGLWRRFDPARTLRDMAPPLCGEQRLRASSLCGRDHYAPADCCVDWPAGCAAGCPRDVARHGRAVQDDTLVTPLYSHAASWFGVASMLYATHLSAAVPPLRVARWLAAGLLGGFMVGIRLPDASLLVMPLFMFAASAGHVWPNWRILVPCALAWTAGVVIGYLPQGAASYLLYGRWAASSATDLGAATHAGLFVDALFSSSEGLISWTPIVAPALVGLFLVIRGAESCEKRRIAFAALLGIASLYLVNVLHPYGQGASFGSRSTSWPARS